MVLSRVTSRIAQRSVSATTRVAAVDRKNDSFAFGIMQGEVNAQHVFPYPNVLTEDEKENLEAMIDPFESVSERWLIRDKLLSLHGQMELGQV